MPILFTGNGKVWKDQELAAAIHYLTPSSPQPSHLTHSNNLLQSPNHLPLPLPNKNPTRQDRENREAVKGMWLDLLQELVADLGVVSV